MAAGNAGESGIAMAIHNQPLTAEMLQDMIRHINEPSPDIATLALAMSKRAVVGLKQDRAAVMPHNPILTGGMETYMGIDIIQADIPKRQVFDWSGCRSPARAKRRHAMGHPQRVKITETEVAYLIDRASLNFINRIESLSVAAIFGNPR